MKTMHWLVIVLALAATGCATERSMTGGSARSHGGGADVPVWVYETYLSIGEEPIQPPTSEFACTTINDTLVKCDRTGTAATAFKYKISVVLRSDVTKRTTLDPFIITH